MGYITRIGVQSAAKSAQSLWNVCGMSGGWQKADRKQETTERIIALHIDFIRGKPGWLCG